MIAYLTQAKNSENEQLPSDCPWTSWVYNEGDPLPDDAIVLSDEEFNSLYASYEPLILKEKDRIAMRKRAEVKDKLIGDIGTDNKERLRAGIWTYDQLVGFLASSECMAVLDDINGLSFELAQVKIMAITNPIVTMDIKLKWVNSLKENLFL